MSCQWQAPCGCIIEFEGQTIDKGAKIKTHKAKCARHSDAANDGMATDAAFDDVKLHSSVRDYVLTQTALSTEADFQLYYERTGALKLRPIKNLTTRQANDLSSGLVSRFGSGNVEIV